MKKIYTISLAILSITAISLASPQKAKEDEDGKVEVVTDSKNIEKTKTKAAKQHDFEEEEAPEDDQDDDDEDEDPNAKIEIEELYTPKHCQNRTGSGDQVVVHYTGWLDDGSLFDTTIDHRKGYQPFEFILGSGAVIKGFERALLGMCKSQKRKVIIPPSLAYGKKGTTDIPGKKMENFFFFTTKLLFYSKLRIVLWIVIWLNELTKTFC